MKIPPEALAAHPTRLFSFESKDCLQQKVALPEAQESIGRSGWDGQKPTLVLEWFVGPVFLHLRKCNKIDN